MGARPKAQMRMKPAALPLRPDELVQVRALLRKVDLRPDLDAGEVARLTGLHRETILDLCGKPDGFPNAWKPSHNRVRIPQADLERFRERRRMAKSRREGGDG